MTAAFPVVFFLLALAALGLAWWIRRRSRRRQQAIHDLLDAADALEARLRTARSEIEAVAGDHENPVRRAMQDILRQRLWLQDHAASAGLMQLEAVREALDRASAELDAQLQRVSQARAGH